MSEVTIEKKLRRYYIRNLPFDLKDVAKDAGANWDRDERAWYTGLADRAEAIVASARAERAKLEAARAARDAAGVITFVNLGTPTDKVWGLRSTKPLVEGSIVPVHKRSGGQESKTVGTVTHHPASGSEPEFWTATIVKTPRSSGGESTSSSARRGYGGRIYRPRGGPAGEYAPGRRTCSRCGSRSCSKAWNSRDLCDED